MENHKKQWISNIASSAETVLHDKSTLITQDLMQYCHRSNIRRYVKEQPAVTSSLV